MDEQELLQKRFAEMESDVLLAMWNRQERLPWADSLLRSELTARGVPSEVLDQGAKSRNDPEIETNKRLKAMMFCMTLATVATAANYYLNLGWFGERAKLALSAIELLDLISLGVMFRLWIDDPRDGGFE